MQKKKNPVLHFIVRHPWWIIAATFILTLALGYGATMVKFDSDMTDDIPDTIPEKAFYDEVGRIFPSDDVLFVALKTEGDIYSRDYLKMVKSWSDTVKAMPGVKGVLSLASAGLITGTADGIEIQDAMPVVPESDADLAKFKEKIRTSSMVKALISKDGKATILLISLKEGLDASPVPRFILTLPKRSSLDAATRNALLAVQAPKLEAFVDSVNYDPAQWDASPGKITFGITLKDGFESAAVDGAIKSWIGQFGRIDWKPSRKNRTLSFAAGKNANEIAATTRAKIERFLAKAADLKAPRIGGASAPALRTILASDDAASVFTASALYREDIKSTDGTSRFVLEPDTDTHAPVALKALRASIAQVKGARLSYLQDGIPFYFRVQNAVSFLEKAPGTTVYISGSKAASNLINGLLMKDYTVLFPVVILIIILILYLSFKTIRGVLLPLGNVVIAVAWTVGIMGWLGIPLGMATSVLPIILIAVGTAYTIHVINRYYEDLAGHEDKLEALESTLSHVAVPVLLAGITTMIGFGSLLVSPLSALQAFGGLSALGIFFGLLLSLTFSVSVLAVLKRPKLSTVKAYQDTFYTKALGRFGGIVVKHPLAVVLTTAVLIAAAAIGIPRVRFESNTLISFKPGSEIRVSSEYLNEQFTGVTILQVIVRVSEEGAILEPKYLAPMDGLQVYLESLRERDGVIYTPGQKGYSEGDKQIVGGSQSINTFIKGINKALHSDDPAWDRLPGDINETAVATEIYRISKDGKSLAELDRDSGEVLATYRLSSAAAGNDPAKPLLPETGYFALDGSGNAVVSYPETSGRRIDLSSGKATDLIPGRAYVGQLVFQYENSGKPETIESFIDNPRRTARINVFLRTASSTQIGQIQSLTQVWIKEHFPSGARADLTGLSQLTLTILRFLVSTQLSSVLSSLVVILVMISLLSRSVVEGLFSLIPLSVSILLNFGLMGWAGIPVDIATSTIASIAIGIGIDYTLHFLERFKVMCRNMSSAEAVVQTLKTTGVGIFFNAFAVAGGFAALMASQVVGNFYIGLLMALIMITSSVGAVSVLPAMILLVKPKFISKQILKAELNDGFSPHNKIVKPRSNP